MTEDEKLLIKIQKTAENIKPLEDDPEYQQQFWTDFWEHEAERAEDIALGFI